MGRIGYATKTEFRVLEVKTGEATTVLSPGLTKVCVFTYGFAR